jgi:branched-chain amino acid transport system ATP-binding protein
VSAPVLAMEDISVQFRGVRALDAVDLIVEPGEIVGLIGPNGAGKTTLLNVATGLVRPSAGTVRLQGADCGRMPVHRRAQRGISRTFQRVTLFSDLDIRQHLQLASESARPVRASFRAAGRPGEDRSTVALAMMQRIGLTADPDDGVTGLPLGSTRLLELAMALAPGPVLLLLDEPLSGLSASERLSLCGVLQEVRDEAGLAIVLVEHDVESVARAVDRIVVLDFGEKIADGKPDAVLADPRVRSAYFGVQSEEVS